MNQLTKAFDYLLIEYKISIMLKAIAYYIITGLTCSTFILATTFSSQPLNVPVNPLPNLLFSLSVEYPTGNVAQYIRNSSGSSTVYSSSFDPSKVYDGYFDPGKCYAYISDTSNTNNYGHISSPIPNEYFQPVSLAYTNGICKNGSTRNWSGNFLNWSTMSRVDILRKALTGGTREFDTPTQTMLVRSFIDGQDGIYDFPDISVDNTTIDNYTNLNPIKPYIFSTINSSTYYSGCRQWCNNGETFGSRFRVIDPDCNTSVCQNTLNTYKVSVAVCNTNSSVGLESNCVAYYKDSTGQQYYKPVGIIQQNQNKARMGIFSYAPINSLDNRAGGLMRVPLKSLGPLAYTTGSNFQVNNSSEIDPATGVFLFDPDGFYGQGPKNATVLAPIYQITQMGWKNSGVINYINQFGYVASPGLNGWHYISGDNVAELFYETIRYLSLPYKGQALYATPEYTKSLKNGQLFATDPNVNDGFPLLTTYTDPILDKCQRNYVLFVSDANTHCDHRIPGGVAYPDTNDSKDNCVNSSISNTIKNLNVLDWVNAIGSLEPGGYTSIASTAWNMMACPGGARGCFGDETPNIAGLSYWAHVNDIRPDLDGFQSVTTFVMDVHEQAARLQNSSSPYAFGQDPTSLWLSSKYGGFNYTQDKSVNPNDDVSSWDSDGDGVPDNFLKGDSSENIKNSLNNLFATVTKSNLPQLSNGRLSLSTPVNPLDTQVYKSYFANPSTNQWEGNVVISSPTISMNGTTVNFDTGNSLGFNEGAAAWLINDKIDNKTRQIITAARSNLGNPVSGRPFQWNSLNSYTQGLLKNTNETDAQGALRLNYIRGDRSNESSDSNPTGFRVRPSTVLGDIIDSTPTYVGSAQEGYSDSDFPVNMPSFAAFAQSSSQRQPMIYVGANDGMLHGFDANTLKEVFAFIPNSVTPNLLNFSSQSYLHQYYVDETPLVTNVPLSGKGWATALIGFPGMGGTGLFALDITNPATVLSQAESNAGKIVLWELNSNTDKDIGYILNRGQVNRKHGLSSMQIGQVSDKRWAIVVGNGYNSPNNSTGLFVVYIDSASGTPSYDKIIIPNETGGLSTPVAVDVNYDGLIDYAYAGDLKGNVWRFNLQGPSNTWSAFKLFNAEKNFTLPITTSPAVMSSCSGKGLMVLVGTGAYFQADDNSTSAGQDNYLFGLWDKLDDTIVSKSNMVEQSYVDGNYLNPNSNVPLEAKSLYITSNNTVDWTKNQGWYLKLYDGHNAMRIVTPAYVVNGMVYFNTIAPQFPACGAGKLYGSIQALQACTGQRPSTGVFDINYDATVNQNDQVILNGTSLYTSGVNVDDQGRIFDSSTSVPSAALQCNSSPCPENNVDLTNIIGTKPSIMPLKRLTWTEIRGAIE